MNWKLFTFFLLFLHVVVSCSSKHIPYGNNNQTGKFVAVNGVQIYYEIYGKGEPLLLIHGNKTGISGWEPQIESFAKDYQVIAVDCRGRGKSELGSDSLSYIQTANDLAKFLSALNIDSVNIVGKSDGGIIALLMAIHYPERIKKVVAFGTNAVPDSTALFPSVVEEIHNERVHAERMIREGDTSKNWEVEYQRNRMMEFQPHISAEDLHKIAVPVLVMSCDRDVIKEDHTLWIYKNIPKANLSIFPGEVHGVTRKSPDLFNETVLRFLNRPFVEQEIRFK